MKILFVCLGNICRSPMAEYILKKKCEEKKLNWEIASAGTENYHVGENADARGIRIALKSGIDMRKHVARQLTKKDFDYYDVIYSLATNVTHEISLIAKSDERMKKVKSFMDELYPGEMKSVPDPWYGDEKGFVPVFDLVERVCERIILNYSE